MTLTGEGAADALDCPGRLDALAQGRSCSFCCRSWRLLSSLRLRMLDQTLDQPGWLTQLCWFLKLTVQIWPLVMSPTRCSHFW